MLIEIDVAFGSRVAAGERAEQAQVPDPPQAQPWRLGAQDAQHPLAFGERRSSRVWAPVAMAMGMVAQVGGWRRVG